MNKTLKWNTSKKTKTLKKLCPSAMHITFSTRIPLGPTPSSLEDFRILRKSKLQLQNQTFYYFTDVSFCSLQMNGSRTTSIHLSEHVKALDISFWATLSKFVSFFVPRDTHIQFFLNTWRQPWQEIVEENALLFIFVLPMYYD